MVRTDRRWALDVFGLEDGYTNEDFDRAYADVRALWLPHEQAVNPKLQAQGREELEKIERARDVLIGDGASEQASGLRPLTLGVFVVIAFVVGFGGMYVYRAGHQPQVSVVVPKTVLTSMPTVHMDAPDISISSQPMVTTRSADQIDADRVNADLAKAVEGDSSGIDDVHEMGAHAIPGLTAALSASNEDLRRTAALTINLIAGEASDPSDNDSTVRRAFNRAGTVRALAPLAADSDDDTRSTVASAIGNIGDPAGIETLVKLAGDEVPDVRMRTAESLGKFHNVQAISPLINLAADDDSSIRMFAVQSLELYKDDSRVHDCLVDRFGKESDSDVKDKIREILDLPDIDERGM